MRHIMFDIEALDTRSSAVVTQVGWCEFDQETVHPYKQLLISVPEQISNGRTMSYDTICWWMRQSDEARKSVFGSPEMPTSVTRMWHLIKEAIGDNPEEVLVWAHGPQFDLTILKDLMGREPWHYRNVRDTRTLADLAPNAYKPKPEVKHSAGGDAFAQALWVQNMWREIDGNLDADEQRQ